MSAASLIANHMNAPYGRIITAEDVALSFQVGRLAAHSDKANGLLAGFFNEIEPSLILRCAKETNTSLATVAMLYQQILDLGFMPSPEWEATSIQSKFL